MLDLERIHGHNGQTEVQWVDHMDHQLDQALEFFENEVSSVPDATPTEEEATDNEKTKSSGKKTWKYKAENVRDFAFASSRKFM